MTHCRKNRISGNVIGHSRNVGGRANPRDGIPQFQGEKPEGIVYDIPSFIPSKENRPILVWQGYSYRFVFTIPFLFRFSKVLV